MRRGYAYCWAHRLQADLGVTARYLVGSLLIVIGLVSLLLGGFRWTQQKTVVDIGPLKATTEEHKTVPIPPVIGGVARVGGDPLRLVPPPARTETHGPPCSLPR